MRRARRVWPSRQGAGLPGKLRRGLGSTNLIDSTHTGVREKTHRITHRQSGSMALRWAAAAFLKTEKSYRRIMGPDQLWMLEPYLNEPSEQAMIDEKRKAG